MNRTLALLAALFVLGAGAGAACGGKVVIDADGAEAGATSTGSGGSGSTSSSSTSTGSGGCDPASHTLDPADFNLSCAVDADCTAAFLGDFCSECRCPFAAINVADLMKYQALAQAAEATAPPPSCFCPASHPICVDGQCAATVP